MRIIKKIYGMILLCIQKTIGADYAKKFDSFLRRQTDAGGALAGMLEYVLRGLQENEI